MPAENTQPKYRQIADYLRRGILDGTYPAGQPLPSEETLAKQFGVTRPTVRQGLTELRASGLVEVITGRGTFARSPHSRPSLTRPRGVRHNADGTYTEADGITWTEAEEPIATRTDAPLALADLLRIPPGEPLYTYDALPELARLSELLAARQQTWPESLHRLRRPECPGDRPGRSACQLTGPVRAGAVA
jgi:GntR family transcriptional regulator